MTSLLCALGIAGMIAAFVFGYDLGHKMGRNYEKGRR